MKMKTEFRTASAYVHFDLPQTRCNVFAPTVESTVLLESGKP